MIAAVRPTSASSRSGTPAPRSDSASSHRRSGYVAGPPDDRTGATVMAETPGRRPAQAVSVSASTPSTLGDGRGASPGPRAARAGWAPVRSTIVEAACCSDGPAVEVDLDEIAELVARLGGGDGGGPAGDVGAGHRHRTDLAQQLDRHRVQRHAQHHRAVGVAEVPVQRRRLVDDQAQRARPERADQLARAVRAPSRPGRRWCATTRPAPAPACHGRVPWPRAARRPRRCRRRRRRCRRRCRWAARPGGRP